MTAVADSRTAMLAFVAATAFEFHQHNTGPSARQTGAAKDRHYTTSRPFAQQVLGRDPKRFRVVDARATLKCLARAGWEAADYAGKRVLFVLPSEALGNNVATLLFLHAFAEQRRPAGVGVFAARSTCDIYDATGLATVYPLWISQRELKTWDVIIDLGHLESRQNIDIWPVDMEAELLAAFGLGPSARFPSRRRALALKGPPRIGLFPLASSPLRTLPVEATLALAAVLAPHGALDLWLNRNQRQGRLYAEAVADKLPAGTRVIDVAPTIGDLLRGIDALDYAVFADSGPAHMTKLFASPGVAVYSSAPGDVLQGRFTNLKRWTIPYQGPHCRSPCGLAKLRQSRDGRVGCMGSLGVALEDLPDLPKGGDAAVVDRLFRAPVPCLAQLAADPRPLADFVDRDLRELLGGEPEFPAGSN